LYTVVKNGKYTGVTYDELNDRILAHHTSQGEQVIPVETPPEPVSWEDDIPIYGNVDFATLKEAKYAEIADSRWRAETGGITLPDGTVVKTDRESQSLLMGAALFAKEDPTYTVNWKGANGWTVLNADTILQLAAAVRQHVQSCFDKEKELTEKIMAATSIEELEAIKWE
jgi:hypothetical protein